MLIVELFWAGGLVMFLLLGFSIVAIAALYLFFVMLAIGWVKSSQQLDTALKETAGH